MLPSREEAERFLEESEQIHPGPWGDHSRVTAWCAKKIASRCAGMDADKAYILALLHDIGRRITVGTHFRHITDGYRCMLELGYEENARICLTHSFHIKDVQTFYGKRDVPPEDVEMVGIFLDSIEYDDYDLLVQLCDGIALPDGPVTMEERIADIELRYGSYPEDKRRRSFELKSYFEQKMEADLYEVIGIVKGDRNMGFKEVKTEELQFNPFTKIGKEWMLITAGNEEKYNTMTASWGGVGVMWGKNVVSVYIRPQRYTKEFVDNNELFTIAFFGENYRPALAHCGKVSGRDGDKVKQAGLTPYFLEGTTAFEEADMIMVCKKQYHQDMLPECFDVKENDEKWYPQKDYHTMYMAEVLKVFVKEV